MVSSRYDVIKHKDYISQCMDTIVLSGSKPKFQTIRKPVKGQLCFVDWINFTFHINTIDPKYMRDRHISDDEYLEMCRCAVNDLSQMLQATLGDDYMVTSQRQTGANFYKYSFVIGDGLGMVCIGGQRDTVLVMINGTGCSLAPVGFEQNIKQFIESSYKGKITRIDLAHDDLTGSYLNVRDLDDLESHGAFHCGGAVPNVQHLGNWKHDDPKNKGLTLAIGTRSSGKYARFYEKGKQLGDKEGEYSNWVRAEVEFKSSDRVIPLDILDNPSQYFIGAYPCFADLFKDDRTCKIETICKTAKVNLEHSYSWIKRQAGKYIAFYLMFMTPDEIIKKIITDSNEKVPKRLLVNYEFAKQLASNENLDVEQRAFWHEFLTSDFVDVPKDKVA